jgi:hypothetical protein
MVNYKSMHYVLTTVFYRFDTITLKALNLLLVQFSQVTYTVPTYTVKVWDFGQSVLEANYKDWQDWHATDDSVNDYPQETVVRRRQR